MQGLQQIRVRQSLQSTLLVDLAICKVDVIFFVANWSTFEAEEDFLRRDGRKCQPCRVFPP